MKDNIKRTVNILTCYDHWRRYNENLMIQLGITNSGNARTIWLEYPKETDYKGDLDVDGRTILTEILDK